MSRCQKVHFLMTVLLNCPCVRLSQQPHGQHHTALVITEQSKFHADRCSCRAILLLQCHSFSTLSHHLHRNGWHGLSKTNRLQKDQQGCAAPLDTELSHRQWQFNDNEIDNSQIRILKYWFCGFVTCDTIGNVRLWKPKHSRCHLTYNHVQFLGFVYSFSIISQINQNNQLSILLYG